MKKVFVLALMVVPVMLVFMAGRSCGQSEQRDVQARRNVEGRLNEMLKPAGLSVGSPVFIRIIKEGRIFELWGKPSGEESWVLVKRYPVAGMSGKTGPKMKEGDLQAPEGFYEVTRGSLNPFSNYHLSFNIGYPNRYD